MPWLCFIVCPCRAARHIAVVFGALVAVRQKVLGCGNFLEAFGRGIVARVGVWVKFFRERTVCALDFFQIGAAFDSEKFIGAHESSVARRQAAVKRSFVAQNYINTPQLVVIRGVPSRTCFAALPKPLRFYPNRADENRVPAF